MIAPTAVKAFLDRPLDDSALIKALTSEELDQQLASLDPVPQFHTTPRGYQKACFLLGLIYPGFSFILDPGMGKSKIVLDLFNYYLQTAKAERLLVLVENTSHVSNWIGQVIAHVPALKRYALGLDGVTSQARRDALFNPGDWRVVVSTYATFYSCVSEKRRIEDSNRNELVPNPDKIAEVAVNFQEVVFDECDYLKGHNSLPHKCCYKLARLVQFTYNLSGTPMEEGEDLWAVQRIVDNGETFGPTLGLFRGAFCKEKYNHFSKWPDHVFDPKKADQLHRMSRHRMVRYGKCEVGDLPPLIPIVREVEFDAETWAYYEKIRDNLREARGDFTARGNLYHQSRQLAAGWLSYNDPQGNEQEILFKKNPKLDEMEAILHEIPADKKVLIFNQYTRTGDLICERLKKAKVKHLRLYGDTQGKGDVLEKFTTSEKVRALVIQIQAGAKGLNLQAAPYTIFVESPDRCILRTQASARNHRLGQSEPVTQFDIVVKQSPDARILAAIEKGQDLIDQVLNGTEDL